MKDYLMELCDNNNIQLIYSDDDYIALSAGINGTAPFIRANNIFKGCPSKIAKAIMGYYTEPQNESDFLKVLINYLNDNVVTVEYTIQPPNETFKHIFKQIEKDDPTSDKEPAKPKAKGRKSKVNKANSNTSTNKTSEKDVPLIELNISSIKKKNFYGGTSNIKPDEPITALSDDVIELDIEVDDSKI